MRVKINRMPGIVQYKRANANNELGWWTLQRMPQAGTMKCVFQTTSIMPVGVLSDPEYLLI